MRRENGFTLVEIMIALAVSGIFMTAVYMNYRSQHDSYTAQDQAVIMEQNLRAGMFFIQKGIRMSGFDPAGNVNDTITVAESDRISFNRLYTEDYRDLDDSGDWDAGEPYADFNGNGNYDDDEIFTVDFFLVDSDGDGVEDSLVTNGGGAVDLAVAENIEAVGFAYAFDANPLDGELDTSGGNVIWAVDSDGGGNLDLNIDTNTDGVIDAADDADGDGLLDGAAIAGVDFEAIRAVRVWLLARSQREDKNFHNDTDYVISELVITPDDGFRREILTMDIKCRNMGL